MSVLSDSNGYLSSPIGGIGTGAGQEASSVRLRMQNVGDEQASVSTPFINSVFTE